MVENTWGIISKKQTKPQNVKSAEVENTDLYWVASQKSRLKLYTHTHLPIQVFVVYFSLFKYRNDKL